MVCISICAVYRASLLSGKFANGCCDLQSCCIQVKFLPVPQSWHSGLQVGHEDMPNNWPRRVGAASAQGEQVLQVEDRGEHAQGHPHAHAHGPLRLGERRDAAPPGLLEHRWPPQTVGISPRQALRAPRQQQPRAVRGPCHQEGRQARQGLRKGVPPRLQVPREGPQRVRPQDGKEVSPLQE